MDVVRERDRQIEALSDSAGGVNTREEHGQKLLIAAPMKAPEFEDKQQRSLGESQLEIPCATPHHQLQRLRDRLSAATADTVVIEEGLLSARDRVIKEFRVELEDMRARMGVQTT